jgi:hypothetical protein
MQNWTTTVVRNREDQDLYLETPKGLLQIPNKAFPKLTGDMRVDIIIKPHRMKDRIKHGVYRSQ